MGTNTLTSIGTASPVEGTGDQLDQYKQALGGDHIPRNTSGVPTDEGGDLGSATYQWANLRVKNSVIIDGTALDTTSIPAGRNNRIVTCKVTADDFPDYLTAGGAASLTATLDATGTSFVTVIAGTTYTFTADISFSVTAGYTANHTALINEAAWTAASSQEQQSLVFGEKSHESVFINFDNAGSNITGLAEKSRVFFRGVNVGAEVEYLYGEVYGISGATFKLRVLWRGIDSSGTRRKFRDNDTFTLCRATYLFIDTAGAAYTTTVHPVMVDTLPSAGTSGLYIFRKSDQTWHLDNGSTITEVTRTFVGVALSHNGTDNLAVCYMPEWWQYKADYLNDGLTRNKITIANDPSSLSKGLIVNGSCVVGGDTFEFSDARIATSTAGDLESGTADISAIGIKYVYVAQSTGKLYFSDKMPRKLSETVLIHPSKMWRCIGFFLHSASAFYSLVKIGEYYHLYCSGVAQINTTSSMANYCIFSGYFPSFITVFATCYNPPNARMHSAENYTSTTSAIIVAFAVNDVQSPVQCPIFSGYLRIIDPSAAGSGIVFSRGLYFL
jgi:hypothetical protein